MKYRAFISIAEAFLGPVRFAGNELFPYSFNVLSRPCIILPRLDKTT